MNAPVATDPRESAYGTPIEQIDVSNPHLYQDDTWRPYFERLRREDPVHWCENGIYGAFWSVTRNHDIMAVEAKVDLPRIIDLGKNNDHGDAQPD